MAMRIQFRRSTSAQWAAANPILAQGELALELDTMLFKIGDGSTPWNTLGYAKYKIDSMVDISDVDLSNLEDGSILIYNNSINKWVASRELTNQALDGGGY